MRVECVPLTSFMHDRIDAHQGVPVMIEYRTAAELEKLNLVRVVNRRVDQQLRVTGAAAIVEREVGKAQGDGLGRPSSVSQPAQASPTATSRSSERGTARRRSRAAS